MWLALPLVIAAKGFDLAQIGLVAGTYPLVWAVGLGLGTGKAYPTLPGAFLVVGVAIVALTIAAWIAA